MALVYKGASGVLRLSIFGMSVELSQGQLGVLQALNDNPEGCDFLISAFMAAVSHIRRATGTGDGAI